MSYRLHLPLAVLDACRPPIPFPSVTGSSSFLYSFAMSTVVLAWCCCHHFFSMCVQAYSIFLFLAAAVLVLRKFSSVAHCWIFCLASVYLRSYDSQPVYSVPCVIVQDSDARVLSYLSITSYRSCPLTLCCTVLKSILIGMCVCVYDYPQHPVWSNMTQSSGEKTLLLLL